MIEQRYTLVQNVQLGIKGPGNTLDTQSWGRHKKRERGMESRSLKMGTKKGKRIPYFRASFA
jgi:hypothetical protein